MLVLSRHINERIMIGDNIVVQIIDVRGDKVRLGITAPRDIPVNREEVLQAIESGKTAAQARHDAGQDLYSKKRLAKEKSLPTS
ncbi:carbon storage regulator CsrA [Rosistilla oblonga]|uniref:carbon storage regulator CsrA n=1 Tax=Rosistilla oblonga TaxID=2527990 RepID=UPI003A98372B